MNHQKGTGEKPSICMLSSSLDIGKLMTRSDGVPPPNFCLFAFELRVSVRGRKEKTKSQGTHSQRKPRTILLLSSLSFHFLYLPSRGYLCAHLRCMRYRIWCLFDASYDNRRSRDGFCTPLT